jgi:hypothetical protein
MVDSIYIMLMIGSKKTTNHVQNFNSTTFKRLQIMFAILIELKTMINSNQVGHVILEKNMQ